MHRTWVICEDDEKNMRHYGAALFRSECLRSDDKVIFCLFNATEEFAHCSAMQLIIDNALPNVGSDHDSKKSLFKNMFESRRAFMTRITNWEDIENLFNMDNGSYVVMLDVLLMLAGEHLQDQSMLTNKNSRPHQHWKKLIDTQRCLIACHSSTSAVGEVRRAFNNSQYFVEVATLAGDYVFNDAANRITVTNSIWDEVFGAGKQVLAALLAAQKLNNGHPDSISTFQYESWFEGDEDNLDSFKSLFWVPTALGKEDVDNCPWLVKVDSERSVALKTVASVLEANGIECESSDIGDEMRVRLPTVPGAMFLYRLIQFLKAGLENNHNKLQIGHTDSLAWMLIRPKDRIRFQRFVAAFLGKVDAPGEAVKLLKWLISAYPLSSSDFPGNTDSPPKRVCPPKEKCANFRDSSDRDRSKVLLLVAMPIFTQEGLKIVWPSDKGKKQNRRNSSQEVEQ